MNSNDELDPEQREANSGMFAKLRAAATKAARGFSRLKTSIRGLTQRTQGADSLNAEELRKLPVPAIIKAQLPASYFTKKHTRGRVREFRAAVARLTPEQRDVCRAKGWIA